MAPNKIKSFGPLELGYSYYLGLLLLPQQLGQNIKFYDFFGSNDRSIG
ncbi:uncharacterized protein G2W53_038876 [Senna tora]|uniref:Uncharacterized protein n=1 Tax=Senna tora TaxID=362788 RepID=A0A834SPS8_9FABA|nr:uncharacterized protein G2W53_038876 [Senna tora]